MTTPLSESTDVLVIGGGPAGSTISTLLAKRGYSVRLLEKERFPRPHVGESLLPFCYGILDELGVLDEMKRRFVRKPGVRFIDIDGKKHTTWCFGHVIKDESYLSFHVIRDQFDNLLLENSRKHGVSAHEKMRVRAANLDDESCVEVEAVGPEEEKHVCRARFLVDATGRDTFLASRMKWKVPHDKLDRAALSTHWIDGKFVEGIEEGLLQIVYLGGDKQGWIWVIPVDVDRLSVGVVLNHSYLRAQRDKLQGEGVEDWRMALYEQELKSAPFVSDVLAGARTVMPLMVNGDYSYKVTRKYGPNFALVGDASTFIDPIFASGVFLSMKGASLVADALHRKFSSPDGETGDPLQHAYDQINGAYGLVDKAIGMFYNPLAINFAQAGSATDLIHDRHENMMALGHYLLAGDFFQRHKEYSEFLDLLQDPKIYKRYKSYVVDRKDFQASTCGASRVEVFHELLKSGAIDLAPDADRGPSAKE